MPAGGSLTLGDVAAKTDVLVVACSRCTRSGSYPLFSLCGSAWSAPIALSGNRSVRMTFVVFTRRICPDCSCRSRETSVADYPMPRYDVCLAHS